jgi:hypothetical protein
MPFKLVDHKAGKVIRVTAIYPAMKAIDEISFLCRHLATQSNNRKAEYEI